MKFKQLVVMCFLIIPMAFTAAVADDDNLLDKTQEEIVAQLRQLKISFGARLDPFRRSGFFTSHFANNDELTPEQLSEGGYRKLMVETEDQETTAMFVLPPKEPRPFLVFVGGLGSTATMAAFTTHAMPFARQYRVGVALVESTSSGDWGKRNKRLVSSGYESGWNLYQTIKALREDPEIGPNISELHIVGLSLGGNDAAFASYFDSVLDQNYIDGAILNISSPLDRYTTLKSIRQKRGLPGRAVKNMFKKIFFGAFDIFRAIITLPFRWVAQEAPIDDLMSKVYLDRSRQYFVEHPHHFSSERDGVVKIPLKGKPQDLTLESFKELFDLRPLITQITKPILWLHAQNDPIVSLAVNEDYAKKQELPANIALMTTSYGGHLGFPNAYSVKWFNNLILRYMQYWGRFDKGYYELPQIEEYQWPEFDPFYEEEEDCLYGGLARIGTTCY